VGVEPTTRLAKSRIAGFEDREDHRTLFASTKSIEAASGASTATIFAPQICNADLSFLLILSVPQFSRQRFTNRSDARVYNGEAGPSPNSSLTI